LFKSLFWQNADIQSGYTDAFSIPRQHEVGWFAKEQYKRVSVQIGSQSYLVLRPGIFWISDEKEKKAIVHQ